MERRKQLQRKTPLKQSGNGLSRASANNLKRTPLKPRSDKMTKLYRTQRVPLVKEWLSISQVCEVGPKIRAIKPDHPKCKPATCLHELKKRSAGGSITDPRNLLRSCIFCNGYIEDWPDLAWQAGLVVRFGETVDDAKAKWN